MKTRFVCGLLNADVGGRLAIRGREKKKKRNGKVFALQSRKKDERTTLPVMLLAFYQFY